MNSVLFIQYSSVSHLNAGFGIAEAFSRLGFDVHYFVHEKMSEHVRSKGFHAHRATTLPVREKYNRSLLRELNLEVGFAKRFKCLKEGTLVEKRQRELEEVFSVVSPSVVVVGTFASVDLLLIWDKLRAGQVDVFYIDVILSPYMRRGVPYSDSFYYPNQRFRILMEQTYMQVRQRVRRVFERFVYAGHDNFSVVKRLLVSKGAIESMTIDNSNFQDTVFQGIDHLVVVPDELEFSMPPSDPKRHVLGFVGSSTKSVGLNEELSEIVCSGKMVVYVAFGTIFVKRRMPAIVDFLCKLDRALIGFPGVVALVSFGGAGFDPKVADLERIRSYKVLPQTEILKWCDLFITHGGMNSIREALVEGVPMLLYPLAMDQIGNARKIAYKGLGLCGDIKRDTFKDIETKISYLLSDSSFRSRITTFMASLPEKNVDQILYDLLQRRKKTQSFG